MIFRKKVVFLLICLCFSIYHILFATNANAQMTEQQIREQEAIWQADLKRTEQEIAEWEAILKNTKQGTATLERDAKVLQAKINEAKAFIKQRQIQIEQLTRDIGAKNKTISDLEAKINRGKESLSRIIREANIIDDYSLVEVVLSNKNISKFFEDLDSFGSINRSIESLFKELRELQNKTEEERKVLDQKRTAEADKKAEIELQKKKIEKDEVEKKKLITINKNQEKTYEQVIKEKQAQAAKIRAALFALRDTEGISFGDALKYAVSASKKTGVRPALILAILTQESDLGKNQGSCIINNIETGDGVGKNTGTIFEKIMKAPRDTEPFKKITDRLGKDWKNTPISCPPGTKWTANRGYGGGMGPSQFIPSTWELFKDKLGSILGINGDSVNPWNPEHSIMATATYLSDLGASSSSYTSEKNAACKYYSGRSCDSRRPANAFYGTQVMAKADNIQLNMIDPLEGF